MTKQDYIIIALAIRDARGFMERAYKFEEKTTYKDITALMVKSFIVPVLEKQNPRFDRSKFLAACGL